MVKMYLAPEIMKEVFEIKECAYVLRNKLKLKSRKIHSVRYSLYSGRQTMKQLTLDSVNPLSILSKK